MYNAITDVNEPKGFASALKMQRRVVYALYIKELRNRFGQYNLGILWAMLEPVAHVLVFSAIFYFKSRNSYHIEYPIFVMLGILPWLLFKHTINRSVLAISNNKALFNYPGVRPIDTILARVFLEVNIFIFVTIALCTLFYFLGFNVYFENFVRFFYAIILIIIMATGFGMIFSILDTYYHSTPRMLNMIFRFLYFLSAIFYPVSVIPEPYRSYFLYNPILQAILLARTGYNESFDAGLANPYYLSIFAITVFGVGLFYYTLHWKNIVERQ